MLEKPKKAIWALLVLSLLTLSGCYRFSADEDDDLSTNPTTNNPNHIVDSNRGKVMPGIGM